jgi:predicted GIY-YIG superfamily endonuclease
VKIKGRMDYSQKTRDELIALCKERNMKGYSGKKKEEILSLLQGSTPLVPVSEKYAV